MADTLPGISSPRALLRLAAMLARDPYEGLLAAHDAGGEASGFGWGAFRYALLFGPEANAFVFAGSADLTVREAFDVLVPVNGETALIVSDGAAHRRRRRLVQPAFHHRRIDSYVARMAANADALIDTWRPGQTVDVYTAFRELTRRTTVQLLFGDRLAADEALLSGPLQRALDAIDKPYTQLVLLRALPEVFQRRTAAARAEVVARISAEIAAREEAGDLGGDVLGTLAAARDDHGDGLSDTEIRDQVMSLMAAGYETTSAALGWAFHLMLTTDGVWERARAEVSGVPLTPAALASFTYLDHVVNETLRLFPPVVMTVRTAARELEFRGRRIPEGTTLIYSPYVTHRMASVWPDPGVFDPDRWDPGAPGHVPATPATFLPFGGGNHRCIGSAFATTALKVALARLLDRVDGVPLPGPVVPRSITAMRPKDGVPVRLAEVRPGSASPV
ncbi:cytochrome P450 [Actinocorallia herbida]|uniref:Cytochrome P450 n=1 Tax=Actinocorallia herbida TaxID=58109 RepID=A0A3N1D5J4_9ACTN|nr:cytochrome P450 [Actinocorallia herbida]ROO88807.1 cytochrome P450 [Actinocorallia herbida]